MVQEQGGQICHVETLIITNVIKEKGKQEKREGGRKEGKEGGSWLWSILSCVLKLNLRRYMNMFIASLFTTAKIRKHPKCPPIDVWMEKRWCIYTTGITEP